MAQLAQVNVARLRYPADDPRLRPFFDAMDRVNLVADRSPGFVWRHKDPNGHALDGDLIVVNLSVWESYPQLHAYVYRSLHGRFVRRRDEWFARMHTPSTALWWVEPGHEPSPEEALVRWRYMCAHGPTSRVFTVRARFDEHGRKERKSSAIR